MNQYTREDDPLNTARGCIHGIIAAGILWALILLLVIAIKLTD